MQQLSFDPHDPVFEYEGWRLSLQVITFENTFGVPTPSLVPRGETTVAESDGLTWAGGQQVAPGGAKVALTGTDDGVTAAVGATAANPIRCTKLVIFGLPDATLLGHRWAREPVRRGGTTVHYPMTTHAALIFLDLGDGAYLYFESDDPQVAAKRFTILQRDDGITVELIHEEAATSPSSSVAHGTWRMGRTRDPEAVSARHAAKTDRAFGIEPWEMRADVPAWMRDVALVVAIHGMHWSGYVFNDYAAMADTLSYIADRIEGRRVLAFLPGWEGRYYWQYGDYRPDDRLGGAAGFAALAQRSRETGIRLMPMFGANCVNRNTPGFERWGADAEMRSASGLAFQGNRPDWDVSRAHDPGWQVWLNPGAPSWRAHLVEQVSSLVRAYNLPAVFFDTQHVWTNDPRYDLYAGLVALRDELHARFPDLLIAGEGWYDALGAVTPLSQSGLPAAWPNAFARANRHFLHLSAGDPSRGSTGVHELGFNAFALAPDAQHIIPTLTVVDGTLRDGAAGVDAVIAQAKAYAERWLS